jgi:hypothetical protein
LIGRALAEESEVPTRTSQLFERSDEIRALGPTSFPRPTDLLLGKKGSEEDESEARAVAEPAWGRHRPGEDAVFAYAEGYGLPHYVTFLETLRGAGYRGDVVLAVAEARLLDGAAAAYLREYAARNGTAADGGGGSSRPNLVVYQVLLDCDNPDGTRGRSRAPRGDQLDAFQMCRVPNVYGVRRSNTSGAFVAQPDPRPGRVVATLRYEWYWIWSLRYRPASWIMLLDARDTFFQLDPFAGLPRRPASTRAGDGGGLLYLFGENHAATRLGRSAANAKWLQVAYGDRVLAALADKPTICSGSTLGEQVAIETYLRAMVSEHDERDIRLAGSDQGFHNYLYYSGKLENAAGSIRQIVVWEQGKGVVNNLGALRTRSLSEWGAYNLTSRLVVQWDGSASPVAHQFDRDRDLFRATMDRHRRWARAWSAAHGEPAPNAQRGREKIYP